jgi:hypothetical protein
MPWPRRLRASAGGSGQWPSPLGRVLQRHACSCEPCRPLCAAPRLPGSARARAPRSSDCQGRIRPTAAPLQPRAAGARGLHADARRRRAAVHPRGAPPAHPPPSDARRPCGAHRPPLHHWPRRHAGCRRARAAQEVLARLFFRAGPPGSLPQCASFRYASAEIEPRRPRGPASSGAGGPHHPGPHRGIPEPDHPRGRVQPHHHPRPAAARAAPCAARRLGGAPAQRAARRQVRGSARRRERPGRRGGGAGPQRAGCVGRGGTGWGAALASAGASYSESAPQHCRPPDPS